MDSVLAKGEAMDFFHDEFRCPVYVKDLVNVTRILIDRWISGRRLFCLYIHMHAVPFRFIDVGATPHRTAN